MELASAVILSLLSGGIKALALRGVYTLVYAALTLKVAHYERCRRSLSIAVRPALRKIPLNMLDNRMEVRWEVEMIWGPDEDKFALKYLLLKRPGERDHRDRGLLSPGPDS